MRQKISFASLLIAVVFAAGCAEGLIGNLPAINDPDNAAEVYVFRKRGKPWGSTNVWLDKDYLFAMKDGKYTRFLAPPGKHIMGVKASGGNPGSSSHVEFKPHQKNYYKMHNAVFVMTLRPMEEAEALEWMKKTEYMPIDVKLHGGVLPVADKPAVAEKPAQEPSPDGGQ